jgi:hypothetical protein
LAISRSVSFVSEEYSKIESRMISSKIKSTRSEENTGKVGLTSMFGTISLGRDLPQEIIAAILLSTRKPRVILKEGKAADRPGQVRI